MQEGETQISASVTDRISQNYEGLSKTLKVAADFIISHPNDVASRSMRQIARLSDISPATYSRLAKALDYDSYEELRELYRESLDRGAMTFTEKARSLRAGKKSGEMEPFLLRQSAACASNLETQVKEIDLNQLENTIERLTNARRVLLVGALSSAALVEYFAYLASWFTDNWVVAGRNGVSFPAALSGMSAKDAVIILSKTPFARQSTNAARLAQKKGIDVFLITDSHTCPAASSASHTLIVPSASPQFFPSDVATMALIETMIGMLVARAGPDAENRIAEIEKMNQLLDQNS